MSGSGGAGASATGGTSAQGGSGSGGAPILEWPTRAEQDCTASRPLTKLNLNPWSDGALAQTSRGTFLLRGKPSGTSPTINGVALSTLSAAGQLGSTISLTAASSDYVWGVDLVADREGLAAFWTSVEGSGVGHLLFAKLDEAGTVTRPESAIEEASGRFESIKVAATTDGYALLYQESSLDFSSKRTRFVLLDSQGALLFEPKTLEEQAGLGSGQSLIATKNGFAVVYTRSDGGKEKPHLQFLDQDGNPDGAPIPLGSKLKSYSGLPSLLVRDDELVVAFSQEQGSYDSSDIAESIHLAKFDLSTHAPILADVGLQAPVVDVRNVDPRLVPVGDDLGLLWSQGSVIYTCGGCMPDNHLEFVVLDSEDFTPLSQRVVLENFEISGGYTNPRLIPAEDQLLVTSTLEYHTSGEGASASIRCTPKTHRRPNSPTIPGTVWNSRPSTGVTRAERTWADDVLSKPLEPLAKARKRQRQETDHWSPVVERKPAYQSRPALCRSSRSLFVEHLGGSRQFLSPCSVRTPS